MNTTATITHSSMRKIFFIMRFGVIWNFEFDIDSVYLSFNASIGFMRMALIEGIMPAAVPSIANAAVMPVAWVNDSWNISGLSVVMPAM